MNFSFYIFGTPNGYNQYPADKNNRRFHDFAQSSPTASQLTVRREGHLISYIYTRRLQEKSRDFLGFSLVFNGVYQRDIKTLFELFESAFFEVQLKGELLKFNKGKSNFVINKFVDKPGEIERISTFIKNNLNYDFEDISPAFKFGMGQKTISVKESQKDIHSAIAEYEIVHITNNEKSHSELERAQQMLSKLWAENYNLQEQYNKSVAKRKQYSVVIVLSFILIGCLVGLFMFNKNLQSKDSQITYLKEELTEKDSTIEDIQNEIKQLKQDKREARSENRQLQISISSLSSEKYRMANTIDQLNADLDAKNNRIHDIELSIAKYKRENRSLQHEIGLVNGPKPTTYRSIYDAGYYYKNECNGIYQESQCHSTTGETIVVYTSSNGYGLTKHGWIRMSSLVK